MCAERAPTPPPTAAAAAVRGGCKQQPGQPRRREGGHVGGAPAPCFPSAGQESVALASALTPADDVVMARPALCACGRDSAATMTDEGAGASAEVSILCRSGPSPAPPAPLWVRHWPLSLSLPQLARLHGPLPAHRRPPVSDCTHATAGCELSACIRANLNSPSRGTLPGRRKPGQE